jgi:hypothetical protein
VTGRLSATMLLAAASALVHAAPGGVMPGGSQRLTLQPHKRLPLPDSATLRLPAQRRGPIALVPCPRGIMAGPDRRAMNKPACEPKEQPAAAETRRR